ncbi:hypothetical protein DYB32_000927 [Aphanomyces invadans]|uniref:Peptidase M14 domain-containing protein n=1 Tax=Aphanomyces invadans TaxID=157072 RepID=A0A3R7AFA4_9STRA|nr:hypothetical protein DYB32_000927 [Aphanomyces invadans]
MSKLKPRTHRTQSVPDVLSSPLPLYKLPTEVKVAKTGCPERLPELPVIRHLLNSPHSPEAILVPTTSSLTTSAAPVMPLPVEDSDDDEDDDDTTRRMTVYSYYDPGLTHMESATTLQFDSIFESGNLLRADRVRYLDHPTQDDDAFHEYELYIHPDINNSAYRQWFYFSVTNGVPGTSYRFAIVNLAKSGALFKIGLQPVVYSELDAAENGGMIDYLTSKACGAVVLRNNFVFKIAPMLNPDGVINGNTRVNLAGWDLNRKWAYPVEKLFPTIFHLKRLITNYQRPQPPLGMPRVAIYCDLHGHSIQRNIFTYGCFKPTRKAKPPSESKLVASDDPRRNTARVVVHQELGVVNSYTLEASFCGPDFGIRKDTQFSIADLEAMGVHWCRTLLVYFDLTGEVAAEEDLIQRQGPPQQPHESSTNNLREKHIISIPSATTLTPSAHDCTVPTKEHDGPEGRLWHSNVLNACESEVVFHIEWHEELFENGMCCNDCDSDVSEAADDAIAPNHALPEVYAPSVVKKPKKGKKAKKGKNAAKKKKLKKKRGSIKDETCQAAEVVLKLSKTSTGAIVRTCRKSFIFTF